LARWNRIQSSHDPDEPAGWLGTFVLSFVLAFDMLGFVIKQVIKWMMGL
jgi:hypothetical protein